MRLKEKCLSNKGTDVRKTGGIAIVKDLSSPTLPWQWSFKRMLISAKTYSV